MSEQLDLLAQMSRDFAASHHIETTMAKALARIARLVNAEGGALFLLDSESENLVCHASYGPVDIMGLSIAASQGIVGRSVAGNVSEMVRDVSKDDGFQSSVDKLSGFTTKSILCAPMVVCGVADETLRIGAVELVNKADGEGLFSEDDLRFLEVLAASAALAIHNSRMAEQLADKEVMRRELERAAEIQRGLLPLPGDGSFPISGINCPARVVSGDFFDHFVLYDGRIAFTLADVSGKGMNAALLMAKSASLFRCLGKEDLRPGRLLQRINAEICETSMRGMFVTMVAGVYDPITGRVVMANAGHEPPVLHKTDGTFQDFPAASPPVGIPIELTGGGPVAEEVLHLQGGSLYIFTDGVTEGYVLGKEELGAGGLKKMITDSLNEGLSGPERLDRVAARLTQSDQPLRDDVTIMVIDDAANALLRDRQVDIPSVEDRKQDKPIEGSLCKLNLPARAQSLILIRRSVEASANLSGFSKEQTQDIVLAVDEACQNVVRHAYKDTLDGDLGVEIRRENGDYRILIRDFAPQVDESQIKSRDLDDVRPGGLGVYFIREVMDAMDYLPPPDGQGNLLRLKKAIPKI